MTTNITDSMPRVDEYRTSVDQLHFSDEAKARMVERLAAAAVEDQQKNAYVTPVHRRRHLPLAAAVAALAITLALGGVAYATGALVSLPQFIAHLFGNEPQVEIVDKIGRPVGVAQSMSGVTVSADAIIGDKSNVAVVFSVAKDDGTPFEGIEPLDGGLLPVGFSESIDVDFPLVTNIAQGIGATGSSYFYDADPSDNAIQLVETRSYDDLGNASLVGRTMTARFEDLKLYGEGEPVVLAKGRWSLSFPLNYEDASIELPIGQAFELATFHEDDVANTKDEFAPIQATIDKLSVSPIALHLSYMANQKAAWTSGESGQMSEHDSKLSDALLGVRVAVSLTDGTTVEAESYGGGAISADGDVAHCETNILFSQILDLSEVASITIGGTTIEL